MHSFTNRLINETSPYLLQHAHNPVDWFPWSDEALIKAKKEDKPILISIGYSACHWCHVMEKESFEDEETAAIMNHNFINIKIDREERPDLDHIYMDAVQAMTGSGGWPLNVFLTPDRKPFYGGTYFPPVKAYNRPSWQDVLYSISKAYQEKKEEIYLQAENLTNHLEQSNSFGIQSNATGELIYSKENTKKIVENILKTADKEWGGFGRAPKFPQTFIIHFLLNHYWCTGNTDALKQALLSLDKMIDGGIYDQVGGGFARYSTDTEWLVPHFEKMLYDNALLINIISEAYQLTQIDRYKNIIVETMGFVKRELSNTDGGFYSALDADSEGSEGKYYIWTYDEIQKVLGDEMANTFCQFYGVTQNGNWEHSNILHIKKSLTQFATDNNVAEENLTEIIKSGKKKLLKARQQRIKPGLDDKIILGWNALMNIACSKAFAATGDDQYLDLAILNMNFLLRNFPQKDSDLLLHVFKNEAKYPAFLDDYAFLVSALIQLQQVSGNMEWLNKAIDITETIIDHFSETESGYFFFTRKNQEDIIVRKKEVYDGAVPSGNAIMAYNLYYLSILLDKNEWRQRAEKMVSGLSQAIVNYPSSFGVWAALMQEITFGTNEVAIVGEDQRVFLKEFLLKGFPHIINMTSNTSLDIFPLLRGKGEKGKTLIYLCRNFACLQPVYSVNELIKQVEAGFSKI